MPAIAGGDNAASAPLSIRRDRLVGLWLLAVAAMVAIMILVGGATRLTDSGLSITEWKPISGALPPAGAEAWASEFAKYRQTAEYRLQNQGMSLAQFQAIYWWEWGHRLLGRLIGVAFAAPFLIFLLSGRLRGRALACTGLLALGAAQGAIGWWMVQSGLTDRLDVAPYRLAVHLGVAVLILGGALWLGLERFWAAQGGGAAWRGGVAAFLALLCLQMLAGAAVAGSDAGKAFADWPTIGGAWLPQDYAALAPFWHNLFENHAAVQFNHRTLGYLVGLAAVALGWRLWRRGPLRARAWALALAGVAVAQACLGVAVVVHVAPLSLSLLHQGGAVALWGLGVALACRLR